MKSNSITYQKVLLRLALIRMVTQPHVSIITLGIKRFLNVIVQACGHCEHGLSALNSVTMHLASSNYYIDIVRGQKEVIYPCIVRTTYILYL